MKIAKTPPGGAGTDGNSHGLQVFFEDFENSCFCDSVSQVAFDGAFWGQSRSHLTVLTYLDE